MTCAWDDVSLTVLIDGQMVWWDAIVSTKEGLTYARHGERIAVNPIATVDKMIEVLAFTPLIY